MQYMPAVYLISFVKAFYPIKCHIAHEMKTLLLQMNIPGRGAMSDYWYLQMLITSLSISDAH